MSHISPLFFSSEKELFSGTYLLKETPRRTKIYLQFEIRFKNLRHSFCARKYGSTIQQKLVENFLQQEAGVFGNNKGKEPQKPRPKLNNTYII